jgi:hypothetical protein
MILRSRYDNRRPLVLDDLLSVLVKYDTSKQQLGHYSGLQFGERCVNTQLFQTDFLLTEVCGHNKKYAMLYLVYQTIPPGFP